MEIIKKETKLTEVVVERYSLCDKCGKKIQRRTWCDAFEFELTYKTGENLPEGGWGIKWILELCDKCAPEAIQLLNDNNFKVQKNSWDY